MTTRYIQRPDGHLAGSIGEGRDHIPTPTQLDPPLTDSPTSAVSLEQVATTLTPPVMVELIQVVDRGKGNFRLCDHCRTTIRYEAHVRLSNGDVQVWGTGCAGLMDYQRDAALDREKHRASKAAITTWISEHPALQEALNAYEAFIKQVETVLDEHFPSRDTRDDDPLFNWARDRLSASNTVHTAVQALLTYGPNTHQHHIETLLHAHQTGDLSATPTLTHLPTHVGTIGKRDTFTVTVTKRIMLNPYCYGATPPVLLITEDEDGNRVITKTTSGWVDEARPGTHLSMTGTVKTHDTYAGFPQTVLTRVKPTFIEESS